MLKELVPVRSREGGTSDAFLALREQMDRVFDDWFNSDFEVVGRVGREVAIFSPRVDMLESEREIRITLELPGLDRKDIEVEVRENRLVVSGKKESEIEKKDETVLRKERFFGSFRREIVLPCPVDEGAVKAAFDKGLLTLTLPKAAKRETPGRRIEIR